MGLRPPVGDDGRDNLPGDGHVAALRRAPPANGRLTGARLVNAMGRAGRAGKETEGWIILARPAAPQDSDFADLRPTADDLAARSTLVNPEALAQLSELEAAAHANVDAIFNAAAGVAADFVSFIWFALAADEAANPPVTTDIDALIDATLAGRQADMPARRSLRALADTVRTVYTRTPATARHRWARAGTSVGSARRLDAIANQRPLRRQ